MATANTPDGKRSTARSHAEYKVQDLVRKSGGEAFQVTLLRWPRGRMRSAQDSRYPFWTKRDSSELTIAATSTRRVRGRVRVRVKTKVRARVRVSGQDQGQD